ncbi:MAG: hypothetical protein QXW80_01680 [Candidatus Micrarchaeia archaeon]
MKVTGLIIILVLFAIPLVFTVNICPVDKNPTEIIIQHSRHPINIPVGITDNTIDVNIQLNAIDRKTQNRIPLANKNITIELVIGSKFVTKNAAGEFVLSDESAPFVVNTNENGSVSFTLYTQPPLLENSTDPRKISYSITATFTPKPKEPFMGSAKTERYVPGVFPLISLTACAPLFIIFALLVAAMFASGKNPFGLFDFSRVAFKAPGISGGRVTTRQRTTLLGTAVGAAQSALKSATSTGAYKLGKFLTPSIEEEKKAKGTFGIVQKISSIPGKVLMSTTSRRLNKEELEKLKKAEQAAKGKLTTQEMEDVLGGNRRVVKGVFGEIRVVTASDKVSSSSLLDLFRQTFFLSLGRMGVRPWSLSYASIPEIRRPSKEMYTKEEQEEINNKVKATYGFSLQKEDIDVYGLTEKGKMKILNAIAKDEVANLEMLRNVIEGLKKGAKPTELQDIRTYLDGRIQRINEQLKSVYLSDEQKSRLIKQKSDLSVEDTNKLIRNLERILREDTERLLNRISSNGALIGFDKESLIIARKMNAKDYYSNYGVDEFKSKLRDVKELADAYGINVQRIYEAYESGDPSKINTVLKENLELIKDDSNKIAAFNYIIKDIQIGTIHRFLDQLELTDEKGRKITNPNEKIIAFSNMNYELPENKEKLTKNIIDTLDLEKKLNSKGLERAVKIVNGEKTDVTPETVLFTVLKGEEIINNKIKNLQKELEELYIKYRNPTIGTPGYDEVKSKENQIESAKIELERVIKGTEFIRKERDNLILMKEIYEVAKNAPSLSPVSSLTVDSAMIMKKTFEAAEIKSAAETTSSINSGNGYTRYKLDEAQKELNKALQLLSPPYTLNESEIKLREGLSKVKEDFEKYNSEIYIPKDNNQTFTTVGKLDSLSNQIHEEIRKLETSYKSKEVHSHEERTKYNELLNHLNNVNTNIAAGKERTEEEIKKHIQTNRYNPFVSLIDEIEYKHFSEDGIKPEVLKKKLNENKIFGTGTIIYIYSGKKEYEKNMEEEKREWIEAFYSGVSKGKVTEIGVKNK